jgi:hypothetical protein
MFNTREYEWADITVILGGVDLLTIRAVKYKQKREKEPIYAKGRQPFAIQSGNDAYEGEIELLKSGYDALQDAAGGNIMDIKVDMLIAYGNPANGDAMRTKRISGVTFMESEEAAKQGDKFMPVTLPFLALGMKNII